MKWFLFNSCMGEKSRKWSQVATVLSASILAIISGNHMGWSSPTVAKLLNNEMGFSVTENEISIMVMIGPLGFLIGSPLSGFLLDKIGRKRTMLLLAIPDVISWLLIALATSPTELYIGRVFTGISDGGTFTCLPIYFGEILEPKVRGSLGVCHSVGILVGILFINVYGSFTSIRTTAYISLILPLLFLTTFIWMPESPYYLLAKERKDDAEISLKKLRMTHNVKIELEQTLSDVQRQLSEPCSIKDIFTISTNLKPFIIVIVLRTFQQFAGVTALNNYLQVVFERADTGLSPVTSSVIVMIAQIIFIIISGRLLDKFGRRPLLVFSYLSTAITFIVLGIFFYLDKSGYDVSAVMWLPVVGMVLYNILVAVGAMPVPNLIGGEIFSTTVKAKALGLINIYSGLAMSVSSKFFQLLDYNFGMHVPFFAFAGFCIAGTLYSYLFAPETKGKTLEEIQQNFKSAKAAKALITKKVFANI